jgi:hypothetical protein
VPRHGGVELERRHALHVAGGRLAGAHGFERFGVFGEVFDRIFCARGFGQQQFMAHADLGQQLAAARALRGEVNQGGHGGLIMKEKGLLR